MEETVWNLKWVKRVFGKNLRGEEAVFLVAEWRGSKGENRRTEWEL